MGVVDVRARIAAACTRVGRAVDSVTLVGVTKYATVEQLRTVVAEGVVDLGENHAQQLRDRAREVGGDVRWHMIGPLQTNKAKYVAAVATAFHALDRVEVGAALSARRSPSQPPLDCYVEVNVAGEATKAGVAPDEVGPLVEACASMPGLRVVGLMAMPPLASDAADSRPWFARLRALAAEHGLAGLSMGTTADFEVAVEEGATVVRVGSALFS